MSTRAAIACAALVASTALAYADKRVSTVLVRAEVAETCRVQATVREGVVALVVRCNSSPNPTIAIVPVTPAPQSQGDVTVIVNL